MRFFITPFVLSLAVYVSLASAQVNDDHPITPLLELQSGALTPGLAFDESPRPIHQLRLLVDARLERARLILDGNPPEFNEFGELVGGIQTPHVRAKGKATLIQELGCSLDLIKEGTDKWRLYRISGPNISTTLRVATRGSIVDGGPARLVILGPDGKAKTVVDCTHYGLIIP